MRLKEGVFMVVRVTKVFEFDAAHCLPGHKGKCSNIHGHTYKLEVTVAGKLREEVGTSSEGMVVDFSDLKDLVQELIIVQVDHKMLNEVFSFRTTAENLALHFLHILQEACRNKEMNIIKIKLWESPTSYCEVGDF